jgi:hypothetical protein
LEQQIFSNAVLDVFISSSRRLKVFKYDAILSYRNWERWVPSECKTLVEMLRRHETSLEILDVFCHYAMEIEAHARVHFREGLTNFTALKELSCPMTMLAPYDDHKAWERLPKSLVKLRAYIRTGTFDWKMIAALVGVMGHSDIYTPRLREIGMVQGRERAITLEGIDALCSQLNMKFTTEYMPEDDDVQVLLPYSPPDEEGNYGCYDD